MLSVEVLRQEGFILASLTGELQHQTAADAETILLPVIATGPPPLWLVLDLTKVSFLDSGGVNLLAKTRFAVRSARGTLDLVCPLGSRPRRVLHLSGIDQFLPTSETIAQALAARREKPVTTPDPGVASSPSRGD